MTARTASSPSGSATGSRTREIDHPYFSKFAPLIFVLIWSSGFIGAKYGLPYAGPFIYLALRMSAACLLMVGLALITKGAWPKTWAEAGRYSVSGLLLHVAYLGGVFYAISEGMSAGLSALVVGLQPILVAIFAQRTVGESVTRRQWLGLLLGFAGVAVVVIERMRSNGGFHGSTSLAADIAIVIALFGTTAGTIYQKKFGANMPLASGTAIQYGTTAVVMFVLALLFESLEIDWTSRFVAALAWQVLVISLLAVTLLMLLIKQHSVSRLSSYLYLVPPLTAIQAFFFFDEKITVSMIFGMAVVAAGVVLVVRTPATRTAR